MIISALMRVRVLSGVMAMKHSVILLNILYCAKVSSTSVQLKDEFQGFPGNWSKSCRRVNKPLVNLSSLSPDIQHNLLQISCTVASDTSLLRFVELREWTDTLKKKVSVNITCSPFLEKKSSIDLPWPMKAKHVVSLTVTGCRILGYFSEYFTVDKLAIPDELLSLELRNSVIMFGLSEMINMVNSKASPEADCGQMTLERSVRSDVTYDIDLEADPTWMWDNFTEHVDMDALFETFFDNVNNITHVCNYSRLRYMEDSNKPDLVGLYHYHLLTFNSFYPEVLTLNFSNASLFDVPKQLREWSQYFPKLERLDLSHNHIVDFHFLEDNNRPGSKRNLLIDLQYNNVSTLLREDLEHLLNLSTVYVNLKHNPITMNCDANHEMQKLITGSSAIRSSIESSKYSYLIISPTDCVMPATLSSGRGTERHYRYLYLLIPLGILGGVLVAVMLNLSRIKAKGNRLFSRGSLNVHKLKSLP